MFDATGREGEASDDNGRSGTASDDNGRGTASDDNGGSGTVSDDNAGTRHRTSTSTLVQEALGPSAALIFFLRPPKFSHKFISHNSQRAFQKQNEVARQQTSEFLKRKYRRTRLAEIRG